MDKFLEQYVSVAYHSVWPNYCSCWNESCSKGMYHADSGKLIQEWKAYTGVEASVSLHVACLAASRVIVKGLFLTLELVSMNDLVLCIANMEEEFRRNVPPRALSRKYCGSLTSIEMSSLTWENIIFSKR